MCGIVGWLGGRPLPDLARAMRDLLSHRGPDDAGTWEDQERGLWFGHRRLSILDLSPAGHQPMVSTSGRYVIVYNGEVFNHTTLRRQLEAQGQQFRGRSDTEVILAAIETWGVEGAVPHFVGMFAFGLYDRQERCVWLVRDRLGIKPLYYAQRADELVFASELRALKLLPWLDRTLDRDALHAYFRYQYVPAPATIIQGARKVLPGTMLRWDGQDFQERRYWDLRTVVRSGRENPLTCPFEEAADELESLLQEAVRLRMEADVPLGAFLSGGVDSSTVVALMQSQSARPIETFTIGFSERSHDESPYARAVATHLGTHHHEQRLTPASVLELIPHVALLFDEPFADGSSVPTFLLSQFARQWVSVALSGDGGDELFGGYPRYYWASRITRLQRRLTPTGARWVGRALAGVPPQVWDGPVTWLGGRRLAGSEGLSSRVRRFGGYLSAQPSCVYRDMIAAWPDPGVLLGERPRRHLGPQPDRYDELDWTEQMMAIDQENQLVDDFLTKVDRASMAVSLEVRVPLLDHRVVEWSWRVPTSFKMASRGDRGKLILRQVLDRYVPRHLMERPKMGFGMPMGRWLRHQLRPWAEALLDVHTLKSSGVLDPDPVRKAWEEHLAGADRLPRLWSVLMFLQWLERWQSCRP
jgi:asparagine synthase (glutamine-hydrolysing)